MDIVTTVLSWIVALVCIYLAYVAVREVEQSVVRRPFSLLLTLVLVVITAGLLLAALTPVTSVLLEPYSYSDLGDHWYTFILVALIAGAIVLIWRDVARRVRRAACPQCGTPLMGHVACPSCDWGGLPLLGAVVGRARQATATVASAPMPAAPAAMAGGSAVPYHGQHDVPALCRRERPRRPRLRPLRPCAPHSDSDPGARMGKPEQPTTHGIRRWPHRAESTPSVTNEGDT